jgi:hypothetical protein
MRPGSSLRAGSLPPVCRLFGGLHVRHVHLINLGQDPGPKVWQFFFPMEVKFVKSFITHPSPGLTLKEPGFYEISGLAYSGNGRVAKVMVSADGGKSWGEAALDAPHPRAERMTRPASLRCPLARIGSWIVSTIGELGVRYKRDRKKLVRTRCSQR